MRVEFGALGAPSTFPKMTAGLAACLPTPCGCVKQVGSSKVRRSIGAPALGFKINLVVTSNISGFAVSHIELEPPWKQTYFYWLEDPVVIDGRSKCYRFGGKGGLEFERDLVINHRLEVTRPFSAGESAKGFLLGFGHDPIPAEFSQGQMIAAFLSSLRSVFAPVPGAR